MTVNVSTLIIAFEKEVYAIDFFNDCSALQSCLEAISLGDQTFNIIMIDLSKTLWFDTLSLCYLLMFLEKASLEFSTDIKFVLLECNVLNNVNELKSKFILFLSDNGFISKMKFLTQETNIIDRFISDAKNVPYSEIHKCIYQFNILNNSDQIAIEIDAIRQILSQTLKDYLDSYGLNYTINKVLYFLRETMENVYNHAYAEDEKSKLCSVLIKLVKSNNELNLQKYRKQYTEQTPYISISLYEEKSEYLEIYVADVGIGIRKSFLTDPDNEDKDTTDENIIDRILSQGMRSHKKIRALLTTQYGGLYDIVNMFESDGDRLGIKGDSRWFFTKAPVTRINNRILQHVYSGLSHGFAIVGNISWKNPTAALFSGFYSSTDMEKNNFQDIYLSPDLSTRSLYLQDVSVCDRRFSAGREIFNKEATTFVLFPPRYLSKGELESIIHHTVGLPNHQDIPADNSAKLKSYKTIIIADIPEEELKKYFKIFENSRQNIEQLILISRSHSVAIFNKGYSDRWKKEVLFCNEDKTKEYCSSQPAKKSSDSASISDSLLSFKKLQKTFDSESMWMLLSENNKYSFINATVMWGTRELRGYLDFSQLCLIPECRQLCIQQLFHLRPHNARIYFRSIDRFTDEICEQANNIMDNSPDEEHIWVGSIYVSGSSEQYGMEPLNNAKTFYFFQHADSVGNVCSLFEWATLPGRVSEWFPPENYEGKEYSRIGRTSFIADGGKNYWITQHYKEMQTVYNITQNNAYMLLQTQFGARPSILKLGHFDFTDHHDLFEIDAITLFEADMVASKMVDLLQDNSYDFLLTRFFRALLARPDMRKLEDYLNPSISPLVKGTTKTKLKKYYTQFPKKRKSRGLVIYFTDYQTATIVESVKGLFCDDLQRCIIPIIPMGKNYTSSTLYISPLLIETLKSQIDQLKLLNSDSDIEITIFIATTISTRLRKELKHIMFRLGATKVKTITLFDRQRLPMGTYGATNSHAAYARLDLPNMGIVSSCPICSSFSELCLLKNELRDELLIQRINTICSNWKAVKTSDNHFGTGASINVINMPEAVRSEIEKYSALFEQDNICIHTDLGLAIFAIENTVISLATDFLDLCINNIELDDRTKMLLISVHVVIFDELQLSEKYLFTLMEQLSDILKRCANANSITGLALLAICAQSQYACKRLFKYLVSNYKDCIINNNDYLLLQLFLYHHYSDSEGIFPIPTEYRAELHCHYKNRNSKLEIIYDILLYTEIEYEQSHRQAFAQIHYSSERLPVNIYTKAREFTCNLREIYESELFPKLLNNLQLYTTEQRDAIILTLDHLEESLILYEREDQEHKIKESLSKVLEITGNINNGLFLRVGSDTDRLKIEKWINNCVDKARERSKLEISIDISTGTYLPPKDTAERPWFYSFSDVTEEIVNLIVDISVGRSSKIGNIFDPESDKMDKKYDGAIRVEFEDGYVAIYFYNSAIKNITIEKIKQIKSSKMDRPTMLVFQMFKQKLCNLDENTGDCFGWEFAEDYFPGYVDEDEHLLRAVLKIPFVDMGSSFGKIRP